MKDFVKMFFSILLIIMFVSSCAFKREMTAYDVEVAGHQKEAYNKCQEETNKKDKLDFKGWTPEQIERFYLIQGLSSSNKNLALIANRESLDPCAKAGGTNVYDAEKKYAEESSKQTSSFWDGVKSIASNALIAVGILAAADVLEKGFDSAGTKVTGDNNDLSGVGNKGNEWTTDSTKNSNSFNTTVPAAPTE